MYPLQYLNWQHNVECSAYAARLMSDFMFTCPLCVSQLPPVGPNSFGLLFDIDGVLVRGQTPIPAARQCFRKLVDSNGKYKVPVVFVTNAGNCMRHTKAASLSHLLGVEVKWSSHIKLNPSALILLGLQTSVCLSWLPLSQVSPDQVMLSHSPLRMFTQFHKMHVLVSGQGPVEEVAHKHPARCQSVHFISRSSLP